MLEKLHGVEEKYLDLEAKLSDPDVVSDPEQYLKYAKAHAKLQEIVTVYREYKEQKALYATTTRISFWRSGPGPAGKRRPCLRRFCSACTPGTRTPWAGPWN